MSVQATFSATLVDEWVGLGVTDAVICPGSRSTPLAVALAERLRTHVRLDERSAAFFALGLAMATGRPTIICVTSGTAAVELHPAVVEAHHARVPLIVCTADRPPELHGTGAPQTIDQDGLYASAVRWAAAPGVPSAGQEGTWRPLAVRAFAESTGGPKGPGPVHLNLAFREPLTGAAGDLPGRPGPRVAVLDGHAAVAMGEPLGGRGIIVVGGLTPEPPHPDRVRALAEGLGWPVMADPRSRSRALGTIAAADAIVRTHPPLPETVVVIGTPWLSKALGEYVSDAAAAGARVVVVDPWRQWADPLRVATEFQFCPADGLVDRGLGGRFTLRPGMAGVVASVGGAGAGRHHCGTRERSQRAAGRPSRAPLHSGVRRHVGRVGVHAHARPGVVRSCADEPTPRARQSRRQRDRRGRVDGAGRRRLSRSGLPHRGAAGGPGVPPRRLGAGQPS